MPHPTEDPFEAFRRKKQEEEELKKRRAQLEAKRAEQEEASEEEGEDSEIKTGEPPKKGFILTRLLRKVSKKGELKDTDKPSGFDDHRFAGTKHGDEAEGGEKPQGMQSDRFDE